MALDLVCFPLLLLASGAVLGAIAARSWVSSRYKISCKKCGWELPDPLSFHCPCETYESE